MSLHGQIKHVIPPAFPNHSILRSNSLAGTRLCELLRGLLEAWRVCYKDLLHNSWWCTPWAIRYCLLLGKRALCFYWNNMKTFWRTQGFGFGGFYPGAAWRWTWWPRMRRSKAAGKPSLVWDSYTSPPLQNSWSTDSNWWLRLYNRKQIRTHSERKTKEQEQTTPGNAVMGTLGIRCVLVENVYGRPSGENTIWAQRRVQKVVEWSGRPSTKRQTAMQARTIESWVNRHSHFLHWVPSIREY